MISGRHTYGTCHVTLRQWPEAAVQPKLQFGNFCSIADNCKVFLGGNHVLDVVSTFPFGLKDNDTFPNAVFDENPNWGGPATNGDVIVGHDVWIGSHVTIMSGVTIGDGAVVAANAHVVKNVPPYALVGGNPARIIRYRFKAYQIAALLRIQWWLWPDDVINTRMREMMDRNVDAFIKQYDPALQHWIYNDQTIKQHPQFKLCTLDTYSATDAVTQPVVHTVPDARIHVVRDRNYLMPCVLNADGEYVNISTKHTSFFHHDEDYRVDGSMRFGDCLTALFQRNDVEPSLPIEEEDAYYYFLDNYHLLASHFYEDVLQFLFAYLSQTSKRIKLVCIAPPLDPSFKYYASTLRLIQDCFPVKYVFMPLDQTVHVPRLKMTKTYTNYIDSRAKAFWDEHVVKRALALGPSDKLRAALGDSGSHSLRVAFIKTTDAANHTTNRSYQNSEALRAVLEAQHIHWVTHANGDTIEARDALDTIWLVHNASELFVTWGAIYYIHLVYNVLAGHRCPRVHVIFHPEYMRERQFLKDDKDEEGRDVLRVDMGTADLSMHATNFMNTVCHYGRAYHDVSDDGLLAILTQTSASQT